MNELDDFRVVVFLLCLSRLFIGIVILSNYFTHFQGVA